MGQIWETNERTFLIWVSTVGEPNGSAEKADNTFCFRGCRRITFLHP